jgi:hypothetical protein
MTAMHLVRPGARQRKAQAAVAVPSYPPGYFTEPVRAWWPDWKSRIEVTSNGRLAAAQLFDAWSRADNGTGWGSGTVLMPNTPKNDAPGWMR